VHFAKLFFPQRVYFILLCQQLFSFGIFRKFPNILVKEGSDFYLLEVSWDIYEMKIYSTSNVAEMLVA
jgi:hypothetical protein